MSAKVLLKVSVAIGLVVLAVVIAQAFFKASAVAPAGNAALDMYLASERSYIELPIAVYDAIAMQKYLASERSYVERLIGDNAIAMAVYHLNEWDRQVLQSYNFATNGLSQYLQSERATLPAFTNNALATYHASEWGQASTSTQPDQDAMDVYHESEWTRTR